MATARLIASLQEAARPVNAIEVIAIGHQFWWEYRYPALGVVTANELHVPVSDDSHPTPTFIKLLSADTDHSFWIPRLAGKTDLIPNHPNSMWIDPNETGVYLGQCAQYCGTQHVGDLDREEGLIALPDTHLAGHALSRANPIVPTSPKLRDKVLLERTNLVRRMFQDLGEMPLSLEQQAGVRDVLYAYVGTEDYTLDPLIRPGAFVQIDPHQNKVTKGTWPSEYDRPVYFVELRDDRYACSWCDYERSRLLVVPSPKSPVAIRSFRYLQDAEIIGHVKGFAMLIAELSTDVSAT
jgi:Cytochrome C oxidase subunit II, periplasmic domain